MIAIKNGSTFNFFDGFEGTVMVGKGNLKFQTNCLSSSSYVIFGIFYFYFKELIYYIAEMTVLDIVFGFLKLRN